MTGFEPVASPLPRECATPAPHEHIWFGRFGQGWIRTSVVSRRRIYSPFPLATRAPTLINFLMYCFCIFSVPLLSNFILKFVRSLTLATSLSTGFIFRFLIESSRFNTRLTLFGHLPLLILYCIGLKCP